MKGFLFFCFVLYLIVLIGGYNDDSDEYDDSFQHATTTVGAENATFTWTIKHYPLINWQLLQNPESISGPLLRTKNGKRVNCSLIPFNRDEAMISAIANNNHDSVALPKIICTFDPKPAAVKYSHERNEEITLGVFIRHLYNIQYDEIKIIINAFYPKHRY